MTEGVRHVRPQRRIDVRRAIDSDGYDVVVRGGGVHFERWLDEARVLRLRCAIRL